MDVSKFEQDLRYYLTRLKPPRLEPRNRTGNNTRGHRDRFNHGRQRTKSADRLQRRERATLGDVTAEMCRLKRGGRGTWWTGGQRGAGA